MTALVLSDLQLTDNPRDGYRHSFMEKLPAIVRKYECDQVLLLGDITEEKDHHSAWLTNRICDYIAELAAECFVLILRGNHDYIAIDDPFFSFLRYFDRVSFIANPTVCTVGDLGTVLFLPHTRDYQKDWKGIKPRGAKWVFTHNTFAGALAGHGKTMDEGIPLSALPTNVPAVSGDVHVPQKLGRVTYVGAPYLVDFGDDYEPRMLLVRPDGLTSIRCVGPQKRLIEVDHVDQLKSVRASEGDIVKVRVTVRPDERDKWAEIQERVQLWARDRHLSLHATIPVIAEGKAVRVERKQIQPQDDKATLTQYARHRDVDKDTLKTGLFIMDKNGERK